jgi:hypothetical protein
MVMADDIASQIRGRRLLFRRDGTHQAHGNSVGVLDDRVTRPPKRVVGLLQASVSRIDHVTEHIVDICPGGHSKSDDDATSQVGSILPAAVPHSGESYGVQVEMIA